MSGYKKLIISVLLCVNLFGNSENIPKEDIKLYETQYVLFAIEYENQGFYLNAKDIYKKLHDLIGSEEYLFKYLQMSAKLNDTKTIINALKNYETDNLKLLELHAYALSLNNQFEEAVNILEKVYLQNQEENVIIGLVNMYDNNLNNRKRAKEILEESVFKDFKPKLTLRLLVLYEKNKNYEDALELLKKIYIEYKVTNPIFFEKSKKILISYFFNFNPKDGISFFKEHEKDNVDIILGFYKKLDDLVGAYKYLNTEYENTNDIKYLAQIAMYDYENTKNKDDIIEDVVKKFEMVLAKEKNPTYQNYLAYVLIDHDLNINKGVDLVKKALVKMPNDLAFLDTLAWGLYKQNKCGEAYNIMKSIIEKIGKEEKEINFHWEKIKECNK
ncbi:MAG: hypothetical protein ABF301_01165 [Sulfurovum sp.]